MGSLEENLPLNPNYGQGMFRRRILLRSAGQSVVAELEDDHHALRITLTHDGATVKTIEPEFLRAAHSTCSEAGAVLGAVEGAALSDSPLAVNNYTDPRLNCTHLLDLLSVAITHASRGKRWRQYDITVWDEREGLTRFELQMNSTIKLAGHLKGEVFVDCPPFTGRRINGGFTRWASQALGPEDLEAALMVQRGYLVSLARRYDFDSLAGVRTSAFSHMVGTCHVFQPGIIERGIRLAGVIRDFSDCPEKMLAFSRSLV